MRQSGFMRVLQPFDVITFDRLDSCRNCGDVLRVKATCGVCEQPRQLHCTGCFHYVDDPVHTECVIAG